MSRRSNRGKTHHRKVSAQQKREIVRRLGLPIGEQRKLAYKETILKGALSVPEMVAEWKERLRYDGPFPKTLPMPHLLRGVVVHLVADPIGGEKAS